MTTTIVKNGQLITSTATEQELQPEGPFEDGTVQLLKMDWISGTLYYGVGTAGGSPIIDTSVYAPSTSGTDFRTIDAGNYNLRVVGSGTFKISW
jgi:hypothetical protein